MIAPALSVPSFLIPEVLRLLAGIAVILVSVSHSKFAPWFLEIPIFSFALVLLLARRYRLVRLLIAAIAAYLLTAHLTGISKLFSLSVLAVAFSFWTRTREETHASRDWSWTPWKNWNTRTRAAAACLALLILSGASYGVVKVAFGDLNRGSVRERLMKIAPAGQPGQSDLGRKLESHVRYLAGTIGERDAYQPGRQAKARDYVLKQFQLAGYEARILEYKMKDWMWIRKGTAFHNVEAVLNPGTGAKSGIWVIGAHYDSAPGTPGADDNASGTAVLLELARVLNGKSIENEIRFVAFGTEEPPSFGTKNMGSYHYVQKLRGEKSKVHGALVLEMVGYYNSTQGSQEYPYGLGAALPDTADFIGLVGNLGSWKLLRSCRKAWREVSRFPIVAVVLPGISASAALSDQLNFWDAGFSSLMVSDTAFYRNPYYHSMTDTPDKLNYEKMADLTQSLADMITSLD